MPKKSSEEWMTNCGPNTTSAHCASWPVDLGEKLPMRSAFVWRRMLQRRFLIPMRSMRPYGFSSGLQRVT